MDETVEYMRSVIARLPERVRLTVQLRLYRHLTNAEIAAALGISENGVEANMTRAIRALRKGMAAHRSGQSGR